MRFISNLYDNFVSWIGPAKGVFFVTFFFLILASALFWLDFFRVYQTEIQTVVISRSPVGLEAPETLAGIASTFSFYERVLSQNEELADPYAGQSPLERRAGWRSLVSVEKSGENILVIMAKSETLTLSRLWAKESAEALFGTAALYYHIRDEVELRVIDGPFTKRVLAHPLVYALVTITSAFLVSVIFFSLLRFLPRLWAQRLKIQSLWKKNRQTKESRSFSREDQGEESKPFIDPSTFVPRRPRRLSFEETSGEMETPRPVIPLKAKATAPANLPVAPEETFYQEETVPENLPLAEEDFPAPSDGIFLSPESSSTGPEVPVTAEPTVEEYKARLNKLLANGNE